MIDWKVWDPFNASKGKKVVHHIQTLDVPQLTFTQWNLWRGHGPSISGTVAAAGPHHWEPMELAPHSVQLVQNIILQTMGVGILFLRQDDPVATYVFSIDNPDQGGAWLAEDGVHLYFKHAQMVKQTPKKSVPARPNKIISRKS